MNSSISPEMFSAHIHDFLAAYVEVEKRDRARRALQKVCLLFAIMTMQEKAREMAMKMFEETIALPS